MFHITCVVQRLLHDCPIKAEFFFEDVEQLVAKVKADSIKNTGRIIRKLEN